MGKLATVVVLTKKPSTSISGGSSQLAVEERIRRGLSNREFQIAYGKSCKYECRSMQDRINSIARNL